MSRYLQPLLDPARRADPRVGYAFAALNAVVSGIAIYVNSLGVQLFTDATLYTTLKNAVVGIALLLPLALFAGQRAEWRRLNGRQWLALLGLAVIGGSVPYVLFFNGLQLTTPVTGALINHTQFLLVAVLAVFLLGERVGLLVWLALLVLLLGTLLGAQVDAVEWNQGAALIALSTVLFAAGVVLAKYLLRNISTLAVMTAKMRIGSLLLVAYVAATGRLSAVGSLTAIQWGYVLVTGLILLAFTVTAFVALRNASATATTAIPAAAPLITTLLVVLEQGQLALTLAAVLGLLLTLVAVVVIFVAGRAREERDAKHDGKPLAA